MDPMTKHPFQALIIVIGILVSLPSWAEPGAVREITWDDLVPWSAPIPDPFMDMAIDDKIELGLIADIRRQMALGFVEAGDSNADYAAELTAKLTKKGLDVDALLAEDDVYREKVMAQGREIVESLDGRMVKLPGYALPLEFTEKATRKFLLVPYVGACIHSPPPPPNQLIVVELETPYEVENVYEPIWLKGRISAKASTEALNFIDGSADINSGYRMNGLEITPYVE